ncbi:hypothetical protein N9F34_04590 [Alphaproteobacteria bacterium]|nr:hypothetical protein [Alphaproteobacteria bacterium]
MSIVDSPVHAYAADTRAHTWDLVPNWQAHATGEGMVAVMNAVGVKLVM